MKQYLILGLLALTLVGCQPQTATKKVYGRYVPERKDDFAWENEYAAFRVYGPALLPENPSNGVDLWLKNSPALVIDTMYARELKHGRPYHINYDGNLDCYKVGHAAGAGGLCAVVDSTLYVAGPYSRYEILKEEPELFCFRLEYDSFYVAGNVLQAALTITVKSGTLYNEVEAVMTAPEGTEMPNLYLGPGIYLHDGEGELAQNPEDGMTIYTEDALSDKQAARMNYEYNGSTSQGDISIYTQLDGCEQQMILSQTALSLKKYQQGEKLTYRFGATWTEWNEVIL